VVLVMLNGALLDRFQVQLGDFFVVDSQLGRFWVSLLGHRSEK
jgi:hypothetical protein